ncbi:MAG: DNA repair protein RecN [Psychromonas sp.]|nr:DNA repair protein RecN [Psychromonas sp.]
MLIQLTIRHFAIVNFLELEFKKGMTTITGETGAGKSIAIDALGLCLGDRADLLMIGNGADRAEVNARFSLQENHQAQDWLKKNDLQSDNKDEVHECILRRVITKEGRSRGYINSTPVTLMQLKELGQLLVSIHSQHAQQNLLKNDIQLSIIDEYADHNTLLQKVKNAFHDWSLLNKQRIQMFNQQKTQASKQLLEYQLEELDAFALSAGEFQKIEQEHKRLANSDALLETCRLALNLLTDGEDHDVLTILRKNVLALECQLDNDQSLHSIITLLQEAVIQIEEASNELRQFNENLELDPQHFQLLELRMSEALALARKHQVLPELLFEEHQRLANEYKALNNDQVQIEKLTKDLALARDNYFKEAQKLSTSRRRYAKTLSHKITKSIRQLNMQDGQFHVELTHDNSALCPIGIDVVKFKVSANAGQELQEIKKVASGGELSRISLAIEVIISNSVATPTRIFDEVDMGISGETAAIVGKLLRSLGEKTQIFCVTHLAQVAGNGHQQMFVHKQSDGRTTNTSMYELDHKARLHELARLLSGDTITATTLANAQELLVK